MGFFGVRHGCLGVALGVLLGGGVVSGGGGFVGFRGVRVSCLSHVINPYCLNCAPLVAAPMRPAVRRQSGLITGEREPSLTRYATGLFGEPNIVAPGPGARGLGLLSIIAGMFSTQPVVVLNAFGYVGLIFFGLGFIVLLRRKTDQIQLIVDDEGIMYRPWSSEKIKWNNIETIKEQSLRSLKFINIYVRDLSINKPEGRRVKLPLLSPFIQLESNSFDIPHAELLAEIQRNWLRYGMGATQEN